MAGTSYTRQSTIADGNLITASLFNTEYNQLVNAFAYASSGTTGHTHDGSAGQGGAISKIGDQDFNNKIVISATDNRIEFYVEVSGSPVEQVRIQDGAIVPVTNSDIDLGTGSLQFKDLYIDGTANIDSLILSSGATITAVLDEDDLSSNSATSLATQQSIKAYIDAQVTAQDVDITTDSGTIAIDLDSETLTISGGEGIDTSATLNAITITGENATTTNKGIASFDANDFTVSSGAVSLATTATASELNILDGATVTTPELNILDGVTATAAELNILDGLTATTAELNILDGVTSSAAELNLLDGVTASTGEINILQGITASTDEINILDGVTATTAELNLLDGVTATTAELNIIDGVTATTQELNYVDGVTSNIQTQLNAKGTVSTLGDLGVTATATELNYVDGVTSNIQTQLNAKVGSGATLTDNLSFGDGIKAQFGASADLQIYHDGSNSYIKDNGTGILFLRGSGGIRIQGTNEESIIDANENGSVNLYFDNAEKLATTSTGVDVTGTIVGDGLTISSATANVADLRRANNTGAGQVLLGNSDGHVRLSGTNGSFDIFNSGNTAQRFGIANNGDISFYEDTGTTAKLFWDASAESLMLNASTRIGTEILTINGTVTTGGGTASSPALAFRADSSTGIFRPASQSIGVSTNGTERMRIDSAGVDVTGTVTADGLTVSDGTETTAIPATADRLSFTGASLNYIQSAGALFVQPTGDLVLNGSGSEIMRLKSGKVGIGTASPDKALTISASDSQVRLYDADGTNQFASFQSDNGITKITSRNNTSHGQIAFQTYNGTSVSERARIDASGNLLVGKTTSSSATAGITLEPAGAVVATRDGGECFIANRKSSDGAIIQLRKDQSTVGSIGNNGTRLFAGSGATGLMYDGSNNYIVPWNTSTNAGRDGAIDLGVSTFRYKDLHLSGSGYFGTNVGIGTTSPTGDLTIGRNGNASGGNIMLGSATNATNKYGVITSQSYNSTTDSEGFAAIATQGISGANLVTVGGGISEVDSATQLRFYTSSATGTRTGTERMRIDSSGRVGIGTSSPSANLTVSGTGVGAAIDWTNTTASTGRSYRWVSLNNGTGFAIEDLTAGSERMRIDSSGNLLVGQSSTITPGLNNTTTGLSLNNNGYIFASKANDNVAWFNRNTSDGSIISLRKNGTNVGSIGTASSGITFASGGSTERMRLDSSGNQLVGTTTTYPGVSGLGGNVKGFMVESQGSIFASRNDGNIPAYFNRGTDGAIISLRRASTAYGTIGAVDVGNGFSVYMATDAKGLRIENIQGTGAVIPCDGSGAILDNSIDLGKSTSRFDDVYATNGTIQTSDRNEKQDIEVLSDAEQRVAVACKGLLRKFRWKSAVEEKGDEARIHFGIIAQDLQDAFTAEGLDAGDYAMFINTTWTDEETGEERSRMGVRYSELLAFIISAI
jgi:hypothetical protein